MFEFFKNYKDDPKTYRAVLYTRYSAARMNLLLIIIFTVLNILTLMLDAGQMLFTAAIPYKIVQIGKTMCGFLPEEYYTKNETAPLFDKGFIAVFIIIALLIVALYLLCWLFSKRRGADKWLSFALAMMSADTMVAFLFADGGTIIVDMLFHILILVLLFSGIGAYKKLRALPKDEPEEEYVEENINEFDGADMVAQTEAKIPDPEEESEQSEATNAPENEDKDSIEN